MFGSENTCAKRIRFSADLAYFVFAENRCSQFAVLFIDRGSIIPVQSRTIRAESNVPRCQVGIEFLHDRPRNAENEKRAGPSSAPVASGPRRKTVTDFIVFGAIKRKPDGGSDVLAAIQIANSLVGADDGPARC